MTAAWYACYVMHHAHHTISPSDPLPLRCSRPEIDAHATPRRDPLRGETFHLPDDIEGDVWIVGYGDEHERLHV